MQKMNTIKNLDMFRGIAALMVLLFHFYTFYSKELLKISEYFSILSIGHIGVDLFFVLSGFLITLSLWNSKNFSHFFLKRVKRIAPLAIGTTLVFWGIQNNIVNFSEISLYSFADLFSHLFFINGFFPEFYSTINPVTWSISIEMAFYLLLPIVWIVFAKKNMKKFFTVFSVLVFLSFLYRVFLFYYFQENPEIDSHLKIIYSEQLWGRLDQFFIGIVLAYLYTKNNIKNTFKTQLQSIISTKTVLYSSVIALFISSYLFFEYQSDFRNVFLLQVFLHTLTALGCAGIIYAFVEASDESFLKNNIITKALAWFGKISYGVYIFHFAVISLVYKKFEMLNNFGVSLWLQFLLILCITTILSYLSYYYFEKRFL